MSTESLKLSGQGEMPLEAYIPPEWFEWELDELFGKCWRFAGLVEDVSNPSDYVTAQAGRPTFYISPVGRVSHRPASRSGVAQAQRNFLQKTPCAKC